MTIFIEILRFHGNQSIRNRLKTVVASKSYRSLTSHFLFPSHILISSSIARGWLIYPHNEIQKIYIRPKLFFFEAKGDYTTVIHFFTFLIRYRIKIVLEYEYEYEFLRVNVYKTELTFFRIENCEFFFPNQKGVFANFSLYTKSFVSHNTPFDHHTRKVKYSIKWLEKRPTYSVHCLHHILNRYLEWTMVFNCDQIYECKCRWNIAHFHELNSQAHRLWA